MIKKLVVYYRMKVFSNRHSFAIWCAKEIHKRDFIKRIFLKDFKREKKLCLKLNREFKYDDFVIKFYNFYVLMGLPHDV